jgi:hypothetical protein
LLVLELGGEVHLMGQRVAASHAVEVFTIERGESTAHVTKQKHMRVEEQHWSPIVLDVGWPSMATASSAMTRNVATCPGPRAVLAQKRTPG